MVRVQPGELFTTSRKTRLRTGKIGATPRPVRLTIHVRAVALALPLAALVVLAGSAGAVLPKPLYGKPGNVQLVHVEGARSRVAGTKPTITFPIHTIRRSKLSPRDSQKICTTFKILTPATAPATGWVVTSTSPGHCGWAKPGYYQRINNWGWQGEFGTNYHVYDVTWATKKKKKLAGATYDFNTTTDYKCTTLYCLVQADANAVPYITFFG